MRVCVGGHSAETQSKGHQWLKIPFRIKTTLAQLFALEVSTVEAFCLDSGNSQKALSRFLASFSENDEGKLGSFARRLGHLQPPCKKYKQLMTIGAPPAIVQ